MTTKERKARELRALQALIDEATAELRDLDAFLCFRRLGYICSVPEWFEKYSSLTHGHSSDNTGGAANAPATAQSSK